MSKPRQIDLTIFVFSIVISFGAFLVFLVQPMVARMLLPELGGAPIVWNASQVFFQLSLLLGYGWAHFLSTRLPIGRQFGVHVALLAVVCVTLPFSFSPFTPGESPVAWMLTELFLVVFPVFFLLTATSPLLQSWLAQSDHESSNDPYFLYSASNIGSLVGLVGYPFLVEPTLGLRNQAVGYAIGFGLLVVLFCVLIARLRQAHEFEAPETEAKSDEKITVSKALWWLLCAAIPSAMMLAVTNRITLDIASIPLLWIGPLALYLVSFIVVFSRRAPRPEWFTAFVIPLCIPLLVLTTFEFRPPYYFVLIGYLGAFFVLACAFHQGLALSRPAGGDATRFYLIMSAGGILGGSFVAFVAPVVFSDTLEFEILLLVSIIAVPALRKESERLAPWLISTALGVYLYLYVWGGLRAGRETILWVDLTLVAIVLVALIARRKFRRSAVALLAVLLTLAVIGGQVFSTKAFTGRSYFGTVEVAVQQTQMGPLAELTHGTTVHGSQYRDQRLQNVPLTYYSVESGIGQLLRSQVLKRGDGFDVGVVGLGVGTLATYAHPGESWTFIEIDPLVAKVAQDEQFFTFLSNSPAETEILIGDGRVVLAHQDEDELYDLLVMDAYSSDSVPTHLLTLEAMQEYIRRLEPDGLLAMHVSNRVFDLIGVASAIANEIGLKTYHIHHEPDADARAFSEGSDWIFFARNSSDAERLEKLGAKLVERKFPKVWTDDYIDILSALK